MSNFLSRIRLVWFIMKRETYENELQNYIILDPKLDEKVLDPACGTGGFLACTIDHKRTKYEKSAEDREILQKSISGVEKKSLPHLLATTNMILHGIDVPTNIRHTNTLSRPLADYGRSDRVDIIMTNPPFGGMEEDGIENNFPASYLLSARNVTNEGIMLLDVDYVGSDEFERMRKRCDPQLGDILLSCSGNRDLMASLVHHITATSEDETMYV